MLPNGGINILLFPHRTKILWATILYKAHLSFINQNIKVTVMFLASLFGLNETVRVKACSNLAHNKCSKESPFLRILLDHKIRTITHLSGMFYPAKSLSFQSCCTQSITHKQWVVCDKVLFIWRARSQLNKKSIIWLLRS